MPDAFGNITPDEASARIRQQFANQRAAFALTPLAQTQGGQLGQSLGNIFGGLIRKTLDTRSARKSETERLVEETGISREEAREMAKETVQRDFKEVRLAKKIKEATSVAQQVYEDTKDADGEVIARSNSMLVMADQLGELNLPDRAAAMAKSAMEIRNAEEKRVQNFSKIKVGIDKTVAETRNVGSTTLTRLQTKRAVKNLALDSETDPKKVRQLEQEIREINTQIEANAFTSGLTDADERALAAGGLEKTVRGKLQLSVIDSANQLDLLSLIGETFEPEFLQLTGAVRAGLADLLDKSGLVDPSKEALDFSAERAAFQRNSINSLNLYIKLITGAQMSNAEADRLRKGIPDPERDGPTKFISKYIETVRQIMAVAARANSALSGGGLGLMPTEFKLSLEDAGADSFGADLESFMPTREQALRLMKLEGKLDNLGLGGFDNEDDVSGAITIKLKGGGTATIGVPIAGD